MIDKIPTIVPLDAAFRDQRGYIQPMVDRPIGSALVIDSKKGAVRANHYHKTDWHYCYMLSGSAEYYERPTGSTEKPWMLVVKTGQMVFTPPMNDHAMRFLQDGTMIVLARNSRLQPCYEEDTVRVNLIEP
jgi:oxalate decarboxylase/phosphoglucose isomerase-like protein (cupin superfamily)